jgi:hypothetical protein
METAEDLAAQAKSSAGAHGGPEVSMKEATRILGPFLSVLLGKP